MLALSWSCVTSHIYTWDCLWWDQAGQNHVLTLYFRLWLSVCSATHQTSLQIESGRDKHNGETVRMFLIFSIKDKFDRGRTIKNFVLKTIVITLICCLCLSWQYSPWTPILPPTSPSPPPTPSILCLHHEQTIAIVTYTGIWEMTFGQLDLNFPLLQGKQLSQCKLILAENNDKFDKIQLLHHFSRRMPVYPVWVLPVFEKNSFI